MNMPIQFLATAARGKQSGVSLIEALLALVVMSLGMLAVVGVQATLRSNGDLSRQRAEAVRLAQQDLENLRAFTSVTAIAGRDFTDIVGATNNVTPAGANASYQLTRTVPADPPNGSPPFRTLGVSVQWTDRAGNDQKVELFTGVARIAPAISASLSVPPNGGPARLPLGRHAAIPRGAVTQSDGTSTFTPPQATGPQTTSWHFNNLTGVITKICVTTTPVTGDPVTVCGTETGQLVTGFIGLPDSATLFAMRVDYSYEVTGSTSLQVDTQACFMSVPEDTLSPLVEYYCVVKLPSIAKPGWSGRLAFGSVGNGVFPDLNPLSPRDLKACRYTATKAAYENVQQPQQLQNFDLILAAGGTCRAGTLPYQP